MNVPYLAAGRKYSLLTLERQMLGALSTFDRCFRVRFNDTSRNFLPLGIAAIRNALGRLSRMREVCASRVAGQ